MPVSGSAYTFSYVCLGEVAAWFVGWNLTLEYAIGAAAVARSFSSNFMLFFDQIGATLPRWFNDLEIAHDGVSFLALAICVLCMFVLLMGVQESANVNKVMTVLNICLLLFIICLGAAHVDPDNWTKDVPAGTKLPDQYVAVSVWIGGHGAVYAVAE